jgi:hypothetical protein
MKRFTLITVVLALATAATTPVRAGGGELLRDCWAAWQPGPLSALRPLARATIRNLIALRAKSRNF